MEGVGTYEVPHGPTNEGLGGTHFIQIVACPHVRLQRSRPDLT